MFCLVLRLIFWGGCVLCTRLVGGLEVISEMEKVETDAKDRPLVCVHQLTPCDM